MLGLLGIGSTSGKSPFHLPIPGNVPSHSFCRIDASALWQLGSGLSFAECRGGGVPIPIRVYAAAAVSAVCRQITIFSAICGTTLISFLDRYLDTGLRSAFSRSSRGFKNYNLQVSFRSRFVTFGTRMLNLVILVVKRFQNSILQKSFWLRFSAWFCLPGKGWRSDVSRVKFLSRLKSCLEEETAIANYIWEVKFWNRETKSVQRTLIIKWVIRTELKFGTRAKVRWVLKFKWKNR